MKKMYIYKGGRLLFFNNKLNVGNVGSIQSVYNIILIIFFFKICLHVTAQTDCVSNLLWKINHLVFFFFAGVLVSVHVRTDLLFCLII